MKKLPSIIAVALLVILLAVSSCQSGESENRTPIPVKEVFPSLTGPESPDDIMPVPGGGPAYRANVHQQGVENPWPPIGITDAFLGSGSNEAHVMYRDYIETRAGETRNNVIKVIIPGKNVSGLSLYSIDTPAGLTLTDGMRWSGPSAMASVLVIEISQNIEPGQYTFEIGLEINGRDYGTITCTIVVVKNDSGVITPKEPYPGNHGITTTKVTPEPGDTVTSSSGLMIRLTVDDLVEKSDAAVLGKVVDIFPARQVDEAPWETMIITDVVIEVERYLYGQPQSAYIAVMVRGGRVGGTAMWVEDEPEFNLGEEVVLFLSRAQSEITPPDGFEAAEYYRVTGAMQGKLGCRDGNMVAPEGSPVTVSEFAQRIASLHGNK